MSFTAGTFILVVIAKRSTLNLSALPSIEANGALSTMTGSLAVSVAMASYKKFPMDKLPAYLLGQYLGAGIGAALVLGIYNGQHAMALASYPNLMAQVVDQMAATFLLVLGIADVVETGLNPGGLLVGLIVVGVSLALGPNAGAAMNPAVDFMPR